MLLKLCPHLPANKAMPILPPYLRMYSPSIPFPSEGARLHTAWLRTPLQLCLPPHKSFAPHVSPAAPQTLLHKYFLFPFQAVSLLIAFHFLSVHCNSVCHPRPSSDATLSTDRVLIPIVRINLSYCSVDIDLCFQHMHGNYHVTPYPVVICVHVYVPLSQDSCFCFALLILIFPISNHSAFHSFSTRYQALCYGPVLALDTGDKTENRR